MAFSYAGLIFGKIFATVAIFATLAAVLTILAFVRRLHISTVNLILPIAVFSLIAVLLVRFDSLPSIEYARAFDGEYIESEGTVIASSSSDNHCVFIVKCDKISDCPKPLNVSVIVRKEDCEDMDVGVRLAFGGTVEFNASAYNKGNECFLSVFPRYCNLSGESDIFWKFIYNLRSNVRSTSERMEHSEMINALLIGDKSGLSEETERDFKKLGTSHVLAISGLHISIVVMTLYVIVSRFLLPHWCTAFLSSMLSVLYMMMTGFSLSLVRAAQMMCVFFFARSARRSRDSVTSLFFAVLFVTFLNQWSLFNVGFLLSFISTFGIIVFAIPVTSNYWKRYHEQKERGRKYTARQNLLHRLLGGIISSVSATLAATVCTLPLILLFFNEISFASVLGNLIVLPFAKYFLIFSFLAVLLKVAGLGIAALPFAFLSKISGYVFEGATDFLGDIFPETFSVRTFYLPFAVAVVTVLVLLFFVMTQKRHSLVLLSLIITVFLLSFNLITDAIIFPTAVVDAVAESGCNTALVRWRGEVYLLDQTGSGSKRLGTLNDVIVKNNISDIDKAVFVLHESSSTERIAAFLTLFDIRSAVVMASSDTDTGAVRRILRESGVETEFKFFGSVDVVNGINARMTEELSCFTITNGDNSLCILNSRSDTSILPRTVESDVLIGSGRINRIYRSMLSVSGQYKVKE